MDMKILVEKITKDVLESLGRQETAAGRQAPAPSPVPPPARGKRAFLIVDREYTQEELRRLPAGEFSAIRCSTVHSPDHAGIKESFTFEELLRKGIDDAGCIYYPVFRPYQLSALAQLMDDRQSVRLILDALSRGVEVVVINAIPRSGKPWESRIAELCRDV